jgi:uncharacterized protein (TIGR03437 family)
MKRILFGLAVCPLLAMGQSPAISPGGVVNAASYATGTNIDSKGVVFPTLPGGAIASIFGTNLAASPQTAQNTPLPRQLAGTSVSVNGIAAPLFYVSPAQINFQMPSSADTTPGASAAAGIVVSTAAGTSDPYVDIASGLNAVPGIFTANASGCGQGTVLVVSADGSTSLNSPTNSASPGDYISIYGTGNGLVSNPPADGVPAPSSPLATASDVGIPLFDFAGAGGGVAWAGRAPGFVGLDQFNYQVPETARQGCAVPLQIVNSNISQPVTMSIASGGGTCADPPVQGYGEITWVKTFTTTAAGTTSTAETDQLGVSLQASPGKQAPAPVVYTEGGILPPAYTYYGPACPIPGYSSLDAGAVTLQGPGLSATPAKTVQLQGGTVLAFLPLPAAGLSPVPAFESGQAGGLTVYQATLPSGTIRQGSFVVSANGGAGVGAFQSTIQIGSPIQIVTALANQTLYAGHPFTIAWTGGDANSWVTVRLVDHRGAYDYYANEWVARASDESIVITGQLPGESFGSNGPYEMVIDVVPDPSQIPSFSASGLSLGGKHVWKYTYNFEGLTAQN